MFIVCTLCLVGPNLGLRDHSRYLDPDTSTPDPVHLVKYSFCLRVVPLLFTQTVLVENFVQLELRPFWPVMTGFVVDTDSLGVWIHTYTLHTQVHGVRSPVSSNPFFLERSSRITKRQQNTDGKVPPTPTIFLNRGLIHSLYHGHVFVKLRPHGSSWPLPSSPEPRYMRGVTSPFTNDLLSLSLRIVCGSFYPVSLSGETAFSNFLQSKFDREVSGSEDVFLESPVSNLILIPPWFIRRNLQKG